VTDYDYLFEEELFYEVAMVLNRAERVPEAAMAAAKSAFGWRSVMAAVAGLEFDSAVDDDDLARVRDAGSERRLRFRGLHHLAEVSVIDGGQRLIGRLEPPVFGEVVLRHPGAPDVTTSVDSLGQFMFESVPQGSISIMTVPADPSIPLQQTEWVTI
jgi:hypothetical protein